MRPPRFEHSGTLYHAFSRGNGKQDIFLDVADYKRFLEELADAVEAFSWECYAFCLMPNHFHLVIRTPKPNLSEGMQALNGVYGQYFNYRHGRIGHVMQGRYKSPVLTNETRLLRALRYVVLNPVSAGIVAKPGQWRWSSYRGTAGLEAPPAFLEAALTRALFSDDVEKATDAYVDWVIEGIGEQDAQPDGRASLSFLFGGANDSRSLNRAIRTAYSDEGYSMSQIARYLGISCGKVSRILKFLETTDDGL